MLWVKPALQRAERQIQLGAIPHRRRPPNC